MIPVLYEANEKDFTTNGLGRLSDAISCVVTEERNGTYELEMEYPVDGVHFNEIKEDRIIFAKPFDGGNNQAFRIYKITRPLGGAVTIYAEHISYLLNKIVCMPFTASSCAVAMAAIKDHSTECPFEFLTDKDVHSNFTLSEPKPIRQLLGGEQGSILDAYGKGEYEFDNFKVYLHLNRGLDNGVTVRYGKNLTDFDQTTDLTNSYTGIVPFWKGTVNDVERIVTLPEKAILSDYHNEYAYDMLRVVDFSSDFEEEPTEEQLRVRAVNYMDGNEGWEISNTIKISFAALWQTEEYKNVAVLQRVKLCDMVNVVYPKLKVDVKLKVVKTTYDTLTERYESIELGETQINLSKTISDQIKDSLPADVVTESMMDSAIRYSSNLISGGLGGFVVFKRNADGKPEEILILDNEDINQAVNVIRMNKNGIAFSNAGYDPEKFVTAWTIDGGFVADFITAGTLNADIIKAGTLTDQAGKNSIDMVTGDISLNLEASDIGAVPQDDFDTFTSDLSTLLEVWNGQIRSEIKTVEKNQSLHHFIPENMVSEGLDFNNWWRPSAAAGHYSYDSEKKCIILDGTSMTSSNVWYIYRRDLVADDAFTITTEIEFEIEGIDETTNISKRSLSLFTYYPENGTGYVGNGGYLTVTNGEIKITNYGNAAFTQDPDNPKRWSGTVVKQKSKDNNEERFYLYFIPGYKVYIYDAEVYVSKDTYTDTVLSSITQRTNEIQATVESFSSMQHNFVDEDYITGTNWTGLGDGSYTTFNDTFNGNACVTFNGENVNAGSGSWANMTGNVAVLYRIDITEAGEYSYRFNLATSAAFSEEGKTFAYFHYCFENPDPTEKETIPILTRVGVSPIRAQVHAANTPLEYSGTINIPKTTSYTTQSGTKYENIDVKLVYRKASSTGGAEYGYCGIWFFIPHGVKTHIYDFAIYGMADAYAKAVMQMTQDAITQEATRATNAEGNLSSRITINANGIESKVNKNGVISAINQSSESVTINANKINLQGYVTASSLKEGGTTTIDGSRITTGLINANRIAIGDFTNFSQLNENTASYWGFSIASRPVGGVWYKMKTLARDRFISDFYTVNGGEYYRIKGNIWTTCTGATKSGGSGGTYLGTAIGLYCYKGDGTPAGTVYSGRTEKSSTTKDITALVQIPTAARKMKVFVQTNGYAPFAGDIQLQNITVTRALTGELVVDGQLVVGGNVTMGSNAKMSWSNITSKPTIPTNTNQLTNGAGYVNKTQATQITKDTVTTTYVNALKVTAGSVACENLTGNTITGKTIQTAKSGTRILLDTSSSVKGYNGATLYNILNMSQNTSNVIQMTIDAKNQLNIRTPKLAVINKSYGTGSGSATVTRTGDTNYVSYVSKNYEGANEGYVYQSDDNGNSWRTYCTIPVFLNVQYSKFHTIHGMQTTNEVVNTPKI